MLEHIELRSLLFIDIETATQFSQFNQTEKDTQNLWIEKSKYWGDDKSVNEWYIEKGALYAEFSKVISIAIGFFYKEGDFIKLRIKSLQGTEKDLLQELIELMNRSFNNVNKYRLCGHNIKNFDIPFLSRRMLANGLRIPSLLNVHAFKPWEMPILDTMQIWRFGDYKQYASLSLMAHTLGVDIPKQAGVNKQIHQLYWQNENQQAINQIAINDVIATAQIVLKLKGMDLLEDGQVVVAD